MPAHRASVGLALAGLSAILLLSAALVSGCGEGVSGNTVVSILPAPTGLTVEVTTMRASLSWEAVAGAASYNVYWSNSSGVTPANGTKVANASRPFVHTGLTNGQIYYYIVTAVDSASREGAASTQISASPQNIGTIDATLSDGTHSGYVVITPTTQAGGYSILPQANGAFLAIGYEEFINNDIVINKYKTDGSLDASFGTGGQAKYDRGSDNYPSHSIIDASGRILVTGYSRVTSADMIILRYDPNGTLDSSFGVNGAVIFHTGKDCFGKGIALDSSGNIYISGSINNGTHSDLAVWKYDTNGAPVVSFGLNGRTIFATGDPSFADDIAVDAGGIYACGSDGNWGSSRAILVKFDLNGNADASFGSGGKVVTPYGGNDEFQAIAIDSSGRFVLAGNSASDMALWRYSSGGAPDTAFGGGGKASYSNGTYYDLLFDAAGRILAAGGNSTGFPDYRFTVARYEQNGTLDSSFGNNGLAVIDNGENGEANSLALDSLGRILLIGTTYYATPSLMVTRLK